MNYINTRRCGVYARAGKGCRRGVGDGHWKCSAVAAARRVFKLWHNLNECKCRQCRQTFADRVQRRGPVGAKEIDNVFRSLREPIVNRIWFWVIREQQNRGGHCCLALAGLRLVPLFCAPTDYNLLHDQPQPVLDAMLRRLHWIMFLSHSGAYPGFGVWGRVLKFKLSQILICLFNLILIYFHECLKFCKCCFQFPYFGFIVQIHSFRFLN